MGHGSYCCALFGTGDAGIQLAGLRGSIIAWMFYAAYVLITVVIWSIDHKASKPLGEDIDKDQVNKETKLTKEIQHNLSHWSWLSLF